LHWYVLLSYPPTGKHIGTWFCAPKLKGRAAWVLISYHYTTRANLRCPAGHVVESDQDVHMHVFSPFQRTILVVAGELFL
jgi:hypothetical protein